MKVNMNQNNSSTVSEDSSTDIAHESEVGDSEELFTPSEHVKKLAQAISSIKTEWQRLKQPANGARDLKAIDDEILWTIFPLILDLAEKVSEFASQTDQELSETSDVLDSILEETNGSQFSSDELKKIYELLGLHKILLKQISDAASSEEKAFFQASLDYCAEGLSIISREMEPNEILEIDNSLTAKQESKEQKND